MADAPGSNDSKNLAGNTKETYSKKVKKPKYSKLLKLIGK